MRIIKLTECQFTKLFEDISDLKNEKQNNTIENPGNDAMSMITVPHENTNGEMEYGKPMNTGSDKISKKMAIQSPYSFKKSTNYPN